MPDYDEEIEPPPFDPPAAAALLREAGHGDGSPLRLEILGGAEVELHRRILELVQPTMLGAGVDVRSATVEFGALVARLRSRDFDGIMLLKSHDPWIDPSIHFHSREAGEGGQNWMGYADPVADQLLDAARAAADPSRRAELHRAFDRRVHETQPVCLLAHPLAAVLLHRRFRGVEIGPLGLLPERWWVEPGERLRR
jgi:ABC-type transport system substrate-binding protein